MSLVCQVLVRCSQIVKSPMLFHFYCRTSFSGFCFLVLVLLEVALIVSRDFVDLVSSSRFSRALTATGRPFASLKAPLSFTAAFSLTRLAIPRLADTVFACSSLLFPHVSVFSLAVALSAFSQSGGFYSAHLVSLVTLAPIVSRPVRASPSILVCALPTLSL